MFTTEITKKGSFAKKYNFILVVLFLYFVLFYINIKPWMEKSIYFIFIILTPSLNNVAFKETFILFYRVLSWLIPY